MKTGVEKCLEYVCLSNIKKWQLFQYKRRVKVFYFKYAITYSSNYYYKHYSFKTVNKLRFFQNFKSRLKKFPGIMAILRIQNDNNYNRYFCDKEITRETILYYYY